MSLIVDIMAGLFLLAGAFFMLVAGVGVVKLPDAYCRAHALGKAMTLGIIFLLIAMGLLLEDLSWQKVAAGIFFQLVTIPVASHLFCLAAYRRKLRRWTSRGWVQE
ncbi:monovalent cation/H(+) antiporter subunit G [Rariglobus hedericola]|uniref:Monovalent cation/H(+) antiporter subunit G n=1 Tax=Rariglobus hedericola TaxID=2597822 RepID=A0A556QP20_9BACT|nr:monovalent cation/H(+) antiporter subunit G [Rariglobus hedericola]TSJ78381.1 monovalent cation/H(+) antiporter subunit G [Rariglobus hedericola]